MPNYDITYCASSVCPHKEECRRHVSVLVYPDDAECVSQMDFYAERGDNCREWGVEAMTVDDAIARAERYEQAGFADGDAMAIRTLEAEILRLRELVSARCGDCQHFPQAMLEGKCDKGFHRHKSNSVCLEHFKQKEVE